MTRRRLLLFLLLGSLGFGAVLRRQRLGDLAQTIMNDLDEGGRVRFICCEDVDDCMTYSPAVYLRVGGGPAAFEMIREAAPFLRPGDACAAAAGLCGFLFKKYEYDGETGGTMSLDPLPPPGADGQIDWQAFDGEVILIDVNSNSAKCCYGPMEGQEIRDLPLGKPQPRKPQA